MFFKTMEQTMNSINHDDDDDDDDISFILCPVEYSVP
jgi:hypothetical protein